METMQNTRTNFDLNQLIEGLQKEDSRNLKMTHNFKWLMWILAPLYILIFFIGNLVDPKPGESLGILFFGLGLLVYAVLFKDLYQVYKSVDYGLPTAEMLRNAVKRYAFWQKSTYYTLVPVVLFCIGFGYSTEKVMPENALISRFLIAVILILIIFVIAFFVGYLIWRKRQKPLRDKALALLEEIEK